MKLRLLAASPDRDHIMVDLESWTCEVVIYHVGRTIQTVQLDRDSGELSSDQLRKILEEVKRYRSALEESEKSPKITE